MNNLVTFTAKYPQFPSDLLVKFRHRSGLSQSQLAQLLGFKSERMILYWEGGYSLPPAARLRTLIELFLAKGVFLPGQETLEIEQLWTVVKDFYDNTQGKNLPYPVFDHSWVAALVAVASNNNKQRTTAAPRFEPGPAKLLEDSQSQPREEDLPISEADPGSLAKAGSSRGTGTSSQTATPPPPNNLTRFQTTATLLGREKELQALENLLFASKGGLIILMGPGGVGKTRLALEIATKVLTSFTDGVYFVNLAETTETGQVPAAIGQALNLKVQSATLQEEVETISQHLSGKKLLLVLDNFEQLAHSVALFNRLFSIARTSELKILITSRVDLSIYGRQRYTLEPLELPVKSTKTNNLTGLPIVFSEHFQLLKESSPVRLFVERAKLVKPDFNLTTHNALAIARICELVDGLPLAIELAAARIQLFTPQALCKRLEENGNVASPQDTYQEKVGKDRRGSSRNTALKWLNYNNSQSQNRRQEGLRGTLEWSYNLLGKDQQDLFKKLAVFRDGFTLAAVCAICYPNSSPTSTSTCQLEDHGEQEPEEAEVLNSLTGLINSSLLKSSYDQEGEPRFEILKIISEFALELLDQGNNYPSGQELRYRHALYYLRLAEQALPHYRGSDQVSWYEKIGNEHGNMTAALENMFKAALLKPAARLVYALNSFWFRRSLISQGMHWARLAIATIENCEGESALELSEVESTSNGFNNFSTAFTEPEYVIRQSQGQQDQTGFADTPDLKRWHGRLLWQLGTYIGTLYNLEAALQMIQKGLELSIAVKDTLQIIEDYHSLGYIYQNLGQVDEAIGYLEQGIALASSNKDSYSFLLTGMLTVLGPIYRDLHKYDKAQTILQEGLALSQQHGYKTMELMFLGTLGQLNLAREDPDKAESYFRQVLQVAKEIEAPHLAAIVHLNLAGLEIFGRVNLALAQAKFHIRQALLINLERGFKVGQITAIILLGAILVRQGEINLAAQLASTVEAELQRLGQKLQGQELQWYQTLRKAIEAGLGQEGHGQDGLAPITAIDNYLPFSQVLSVALEYLD